MALKSRIYRNGKLCLPGVNIAVWGSLLCRFMFANDGKYTEVYRAGVTENT